MDTSSIKYGPGVTREVGFDMKSLGARRVLVVTDPNLAGSDPVKIAMDALKAQGIDVVLYDQVRVEPTDRSFKEAIAFATEGAFDGYVAVGGGSTMDKAKAANLYATHPAVFRFTGPARPEAHKYAAGLMGVDVSDVADEEVGEVLAQATVEIMKQTGMPNGLAAVGFSEADVDALAEGTLPQHRVTKLSPRQADKEDLKQLFLDSMVIW